ncbi:3-dehydroquinate synthase [Microbacterium sp. zg.Y625]|uniref:3-dehydroquinate synthase n=1 Tax=Microbacterium jiangjiandongii TaxID=3049071 RepID=UPI00214C3904|nr:MULTISPECIES: 3-dehydroquinate synthase [unclassified Microbacterium]MCR2792661.1 3-dehydroquinate synthase [Microbacterium sp. zg.Y625]WIM26644.1 3-dehydroquinate synthase [Microbacterium sp. zg-Y625]
MTDTTTISVTGSAPHDILVGRGILSQLPELVPAEAKKVLVVHPPTLRDAAEALRLQLTDALGGGRQVLLAEIPDAEAGKRIEVAAFCWQVMGQADFTRTDVVIGFGGGAVTDLAGFVAATWLRGVKVILVPTTVLGMVDAAVGGKTGVNTAEGKNLVGAFWAPHAVLCDLEMLDSLGANERIAGYAEVVKAGFIWAPEILDLIEADPVAAVDPSSPAFRRTMELAIDMKARVVSEDFREAGLREILNYGHTLGHAIEHAERYQWRHGAAVSVGMMFAAELSRLAGRLPDAAAQRHRDVLETLGLPLSYRPGAWPQLLATMQRDKKTRGGMLRFIVLDDIARPTVLQAPDESLLFAAYQELSE